MNRSIALFASMMSFAAPAVAEGPVVIELYTSQGCSSCPPADAILHDLAQRSDVIPLALHVDYWDYIGWEDSFADPEHTERQQDYVRVAGGSTIYTPQMIVAGQSHVIGAKGMEIEQAIQNHADQATGVNIDLARDGDRLMISGETNDALPRGTVVQVVRYSPEETVDVRRGENAGRILSYANVVTSWDIVTGWSGSADLDFSVDVEGAEPIVVIVQEAGPGAVLASAVLR